MKQYYECHITICPTFTNDDERLVTKSGWVFSRITDDIVLGKGAKAYATKHFNIRKDEQVIVTELEATAHKYRQAGLIVFRTKVEKVIYDNR